MVKNCNWKYFSLAKMPLIKIDKYLGIWRVKPLSESCFFSFFLFTLPRAGVHLHFLDDAVAEDRLDGSVLCWRNWRKLSLDCGASRAWKACAAAGVSCPVYQLSPHIPCCWWPPFIILHCKSNARKIVWITISKIFRTSVNFIHDI